MSAKFKAPLNHRDKERIRHQSINKAIDFLCHVIPGNNGYQETKVVKLERIIRYCYFLESLVDKLSAEVKIPVERNLKFINSPLLIKGSPSLELNTKTDMSPKKQALQCLNTSKVENMPELQKCKLPRNFSRYITKNGVNSEGGFFTNGVKIPSFHVASESVATHTKSSLTDSKDILSAPKSDENLSNSVCSRSSRSLQKRKREYENSQHIYSESQVNSYYQEHFSSLKKLIEGSKSIHDYTMPNDASVVKNYVEKIPQIKRKWAISDTCRSPLLTVSSKIPKTIKIVKN